MQAAYCRAQLLSQNLHLNSHFLLFPNVLGAYEATLGAIMGSLRHLCMTLTSAGNACAVLAIEYAQLVSENKHGEHLW